MRHNLWDRMMYRLLQEKKEKEVKASKSKGSKPDFLDLDKDGDKEEPMSKAAKEAGGKKDTPKAKKGKGKIPPQLRMHIAKKKKAKKSKIDEAIEKLEKILFENLEVREITEEQADAMLDEYGDESMEEGLYSNDYKDDDDLYEGDERYLTEAEVKKKQPRLGKVTRNPAGSKKKFHVYVKCGGRVKKISFGDPGLSIKRDSPARRKNFRARHKCDKPAGKDRCTARY